MNERLNAIVGARISKFKKKMSDVKKTISDLPRNVTTKINVKVDEFQNKMDRIAQTITSVGTVGANMFKGGLLSVLPMLVPMIASLAGGLGGLATSFAAAGSGAIMFGSVAATSLIDVFKAGKNISQLKQQIASTKDTELRAKYIEKLKQQTANLSKEQLRGVEALQKFAKFWGKFATQFERPVMNVFVRSLEQLKTLLKQLQPGFQAAVKAFDTLSKSLGKALKTPEFQRFVSFLNTNVGPAITNLGKSFGNIFKGIMNLMVAFNPLAREMQTGLVGMTEKFAKWTAGLKNSKSFEKFINYVRENGPKVMKLIGNLTKFLIKLGKGMAPIGSWLLDMTNKFLGFTNSLMKNHPWIGKIIGILVSLTGALIAVVPAAILLRTAFGGLVGKMIKGMAKLSAKMVTWSAKQIAKLTKVGAKYTWLAIKKVATTTASIIKSFARMTAKAAVWAGKMMLNMAKVAAKYAWLGVKALLHAGKIAASWFIALGPVGWVIATVIGLVALIVANWDKVKKWTVKTFGSAFDAAKKYMGMMKDNIARAWKFIKDSFGNALDFVKALLEGDFKGMWKAVKKQMGNIEDTVSDIWDNVQDFLEDIDLKKIGKDIINGLIDGIKAMADKAFDAVKDIGEGIKKKFMNLLDMHSPSKVFKQYGNWIGDGLIGGLYQMVSPVGKSAEKLAETVSNTAKKAFQNSKSWIDQRKFYNKMALTEELEAWKRVQSRYKLDTEERKKADRQVYNVKKQIHNKLMELNDKYLGKIKATNQALIQEEKRLNEAYKQTLQSRTESLYNFAGLFDKFTKNTKTGGQQLIRNLKSQVEGFRNWSQDIKELAKRGIDKGLLKELREMGPQAAGEISALNGLTDTQLAKYVTLWKEKNKLARTEAKRQLEGMRIETQKKIKLLRANAAKQLDALKVEWSNKIKSIKTGTEGTFGKMSDTLPGIGKNAMKGLLNGISSMEGELLTKARNIANSISRTMERALQIHSPSRVMKRIGEYVGQGLADGITSQERLVKSAAKGLAKAAVPDTRSVDIGYNPALSSGVISTPKTSIPSDYESRSSDSGSTKGGITQKITINSPTPLSPSEVARKQKQASRQLAAEWGMR